MKRPYLILFALLASFACEEGSLLENTEPETRVFIDVINLEGADRLNSIVRLYWSGEDQDGYVAGYEFSFDQNTWVFTTRTDSLFRFKLPSGKEQEQITFYVRAVDDKEARDPSPASLLIPIKNTAPTVLLDTRNPIADSVYVVFAARWKQEDLDGQETLDSVFIRFNQGAWYALGPEVNFINLIPLEPAKSGVQNARVLVGAGAVEQVAPVGGLVINGENRLYIKVRDVTGTFSRIDSSGKFFLLPQRSDLLLIDTHVDRDPEQVYFPIIKKVYPGFDYIDLVKYPPLTWDPTFTLYLSLYDKVFWYSDDAEPAALSQQMYLETAATPLQLYLNQGGKLLISTKFPPSISSPVDGNQSVIFGYSPLDSLSTSRGQARIPIDSLAVSLNPDFPTLTCSSFITGADPFYPKSAQNALYRVQLISTGGWRGPRTIAAQSQFTNGKTNQIFFSVELHKFGKNVEALTRFFDQTLNTAFNW